MGIGIGTIAIADGAILIWAVGAATAGYVVLGLGGAAMLLSLVVWSRSYAARRRWASRSRFGQP